MALTTGFIRPNAKAVIQTDNYDAALAIARECPGYDGSWPGYSIEIREMGGYA